MLNACLQEKSALHHDRSPCRVVVLVSGGGSNLQALIDAQQQGGLAGVHLSCVISSNHNAGALVRAKTAGIQTAVVARRDFSSQDAYTIALQQQLKAVGADLIVLAGFLQILDKRLTDAYPYRMINVHPSLIPSFCGKGCYGLRVHEQALAYGVKYSGATVHFVSEIPDGGAIILQKPVPVYPNDTPQLLQQRVMEQAEWVLLPQAVRLFAEGKIKVSANNLVTIEEAF